MAPSETVTRIKGRTESKLFEEFPHLNKRYWGRIFGHVGTLVRRWSKDGEMIKHYLEHHLEQNPNDNFKMEPD